MHPILAARGLWMYLAAWVPVGGLLAALLAQPGDLSWPAALLVALPLALVHAFICLASWYPVRTLPLPRASAPRLLVVHGAAAFASSALWLAIGSAWARLIGAFQPLAGVTGQFRDAIPLLFVVGVLLFVLSTAVHYLLVAFAASREAETRALEMRALAREAELRSLRAQINPHFLFNSLHSVSALTSSDPAGARRMCLLLSEFFRASLSLGSRERIALAEELSLIFDQYLAIEKVRFGARLGTELAIDEAAARCEVPPLLLQPLVENAIAHGIANLVDGGVVRIEARRLGSQLTLTVDNPYDRDQAERAGTGVGLENVRQRMAAAFGQDAALRLSRRDGRFRVELELPVEELRD